MEKNECVMMIAASGNRFGLFTTNHAFLMNIENH